MNTTLVLPPRLRQGYLDNRSPCEWVTIGYVKHRVFWPVLLSAFLLLSGLVFLTFQGDIALVVELPTSYVVQADTLEIINGKLVLGVSASNNTLPVSIVTADEEILTHVSISKDACIPLVGKVTFTIHAADGKTPAQFFGARTDIQALSTDFASVQNDVTSTNAPYGVKLTASEKLYGVRILAPFISANSLTLPDATITVTRSGTC